MQANKRTETEVRSIPAGDLVGIVLDAEEKRYRNLSIYSDNLRLELVSIAGNKVFQDLKSRNTSIIFDANFDHFVTRTPMRRRASAVVSVVVNADQIEG